MGPFIQAKAAQWLNYLCNLGNFVKLHTEFIAVVYLWLIYRNIHDNNKPMQSLDNAGE